MTLDANIIIAYISGERTVIEAVIGWRREGKLLFLPTVAETEVLAFPEWTNEELLKTEKFLEDNFASIALDRPIAKIAAELRRTTKIKFPDAAVATTGLVS